MFTRKSVAAALIGVGLVMPVSAQEVTLRLHHFLPMTDSVPIFSIRRGTGSWT
jgi:hypothetical protein